MMHISGNEFYFDFVALNNHLVLSILLVKYIMKNNVIIYNHVLAYWSQVSYI